MTKESLVVHNPNHAVISFKLDKGVDDHIAGLSRHKQKRLIRCFSHNVALPSRQSVDLVRLSGLTVKEIKESTEYLQMQNYFQVMYDSSLVDIEEPEDVEPKTVDEVNQVDAEDLDGVLTEDKAETLDEVMDEEYPAEAETPDSTSDTLWVPKTLTVDDIEQVREVIDIEKVADVVEPEPEPKSKKKAVRKPKMATAKKTKKKTAKKSTKKGK